MFTSEVKLELLEDMGFSGYIDDGGNLRFTTGEYMPEWIVQLADSILYAGWVKEKK